MLSRCQDRLQWLKNGSRQVFGTLLEERVVIAIDSSSSLKERLNLIKSKVKELLQVREPWDKELESFSQLQKESDVISF